VDNRSVSFIYQRIDLSVPAIRNLPAKSTGIHLYTGATN
jgi:hypothetical protein